MGAGSVTLRDTAPADLERLFQFQLDEEGRRLAAFMAADSTDREAYVAKYTRFLHDPTIRMQTILLDGVVAGSIARFEVQGDAELTYWISRDHWGRGVATAALRRFLALEHGRPLFGRVAFDNVGSQRVLEKAGFVQVGTDRGFAGARQAVIEELIYELR